jgi:hypothetical protein
MTSVAGRPILSTRIDPDLLDWVDEQAKERKLSRGQMAERMLERVREGTQPKEA